jgi:hypothetical protein
LKLTTSSPNSNAASAKDIAQRKRYSGSNPISGKDLPVYIILGLYS